jgi:hypothetical protein
MTGYDQSPDHGGPDPTWKGTLFVVLLIAVVCGGFALILLR